jgi:hypothetical protein
MNWKTWYIIVGIIWIGLGISRILEFRDPGYGGWPAVTNSCKICKERVWIWQRHERRSYKVPIGNQSSPNSGIFIIEATLSAIVHTSCTGEPVIDSIKVEPYKENEKLLKI